MGRGTMSARRPSSVGLLALAVLSAIAAMLAFPAANPSAKPSEPLGDTHISPAAFVQPLRNPVARKPTAYRIVRVKPGRTASMRSQPAGNTIGRLGTTTEFGSRR